jgi:hypothetical protein
MKITKHIKHGNRATREVLRGYINPTLLRKVQQPRDVGDALVIAGHFRSGTTWFAEVLAKAISGGILFEPFNILNVPEARKAGFTFQNYHEPEDAWPEGEAFARDVFCGRILNKWTTSQIPIGKSFDLKRWVVKLVCANQMLGWLTAKVDIRPPVLLIRHPCAVLASWKSRGWRLNDWIIPDQRFLQARPEIKDILDGLTTKEEYFAARWCMDHYAPFSLDRPYPFLTVSYEKLVIEGDRYIDEIFGHCDVSLPDWVRDEIKSPSAKVSAEFSSSPKNILMRWKDMLSEKQIDRVLRVVEDFGLDFYTRDLEPDYDRMFGPAPIRR